MNRKLILRQFRSRLQSEGRPERAEKEKQYLKSPYKFFGASVPVIERVAKDFRRENRDISHVDLFALAETLWKSEYHEEKSLAVKLLAHYPEKLDMGSMPLFEGMLSECVGWDHTDWISIHLVGDVLAKDKAAYEYLRKWSGSENRWMRRASLISQILLFRRGRGNRRLFFSFARRMITEKEFFIRKAIGWSLREISKADPEMAYNFIMEVKEVASGLTLREGSRLLPDEMRKQVLPGR